MSTGPMLVMTGAASGIGRATARALAAKGYRLGLVDRDPEGLASIAGELGAASRTADVTDRDGLREAIEALENEAGPADVLLACAGIGAISAYPDLDAPRLRAILDVNVVGVAHAIEAVLPGMIARGRGHLVGVSSVAGYRGMPWMASYSASKAALSVYLEAIRPALKRRGVRITTLYPGFVRTPLTEGTSFSRPVPMLTAEQAASYVVRGIERRARDFVFPLSTKLGMAFLRSMPNFLFDRMMDHAGPRALTTDF